MKWLSKYGFTSSAASEHEAPFTQFRDWLKDQREASPDMLWSPVVGERADAVVFDFEQPNVRQWPLNMTPWHIYQLFDYESDTNYLCFMHPTKTPGNFRLIVEYDVTRADYRSVQKHLIAKRGATPQPCEASMGPDRWWFVRSMPREPLHRIERSMPREPLHRVVRSMPKESLPRAEAGGVRSPEGGEKTPEPQAVLIAGATMRLSRGLAEYEDRSDDLAVQLLAMRGDIDFLLNALGGGR